MSANEEVVAGVGRVLLVSPAMREIVGPEPRIEMLGNGFGFTEGPIWRREGDLLFSDIVMPGKTGVELAREARVLRPGLGIVLTTGYSEDAARLDGARVLAKPYHIETLVKALAEEMDKLRTSH